MNYPQIDRLVSNISEGIKSVAMEGGARPPTFCLGGGGGGTGVFQVTEIIDTKTEEEKEEISAIFYRWQCWITKCSNIVVCKLV